MTDEEFVKLTYPDATCFGPVKIYWPFQGTRERYIVNRGSWWSGIDGSGLTPEQAWASAAAHLRSKTQP